MEAVLDRLGAYFGEVRALPRETADQLDPYVRPKFVELWEAAQHPEDDY